MNQLHELISPPGEVSGRRMVLAILEAPQVGDEVVGLSFEYEDELPRWIRVDRLVARIVWRNRVARGWTPRAVAPS